MTFKVGDRVIVGSKAPPGYQGWTGTIIRAYNNTSGEWLVMLDKPINPWPEGCPFIDWELELLEPLTPFERRVQDYIDKELS